MSETIRDASEGAEGVSPLVEAAGRASRVPRGQWLRLAFDHWPVTVFFVTAAVAVLGRLMVGVSPLQPFQEIARRQEEYRFKVRSVNRHVGLGTSFLNVDQLAAAEAEFREALALDPANPSAQMGLFKADLIRAVFHSEDPIDPEILNKRIQLLFAEDPDDPHALTLMGMIYEGISRDSAALYFNRAVERDSTLGLAYFQMAHLEEEKESTDSALVLYEKAARVSPWNQVYLNNLALQLYKQERWEEAARRYDDLLKLNDSFILTHITYGNTLRFLGRLDGASMQHSRALDLMSDTLRLQKEFLGNWVWYVPTADGEVFIRSPRTALGHVLFVSALTEYVLGRPDIGQSRLARAARLSRSELTPVLRIAAFEMSQLARSRQGADPAVCAGLEAMARDIRASPAFASDEPLEVSCLGKARGGS